jgi:hypothetical protein
VNGGSFGISVVEQREETGTEGKPGPGPSNNLIYDLEAHPAVSTRPLPKGEMHAVLKKRQRSPYLTTSLTHVVVTRRLSNEEWTLLNQWNLYQMYQFLCVDGWD